MHELAKTGRWLGGTTPTGYASESVKHITVDGKSKKACKLKLVPEEADTIRLIYKIFQESDSLTYTEAELMKRGIKTKNGKYHTRFSIKSILQNPVYVIADDEVYNYLVNKDADLFSDKAAFDGVHGLMVYNRTDQEKGRATRYLSPEEWIVSVGEHPGIIPGREWIRIQESLHRNKSKAYRKPRGNEALLTGLLFCRCGSRMYPKLSKRKTADGKRICTYVCKIKDRSKHKLCDERNANGNTLDLAIIEQIKVMEDNQGTFIAQLEQSRKFYTGNRTDYEDRLAAARRDKAEAEKKVEALVDSLAAVDDSTAKGLVIKRIEKLSQECRNIDSRIQELEGLTEQYHLSDIEFDVFRQLLTMFKSNIDTMTVEEKRAAIRTLVRKVVWDGTNAHVVLFGVPDEEIEYPDLPTVSGGSDDEDDTDDLELFADVDYEEDDSLGKTQPLSSAKARWGENSK